MKFRPKVTSGVALVFIGWLRLLRFLAWKPPQRTAPTAQIVIACTSSKRSSEAATLPHFSLCHIALLSTNGRSNFYFSSCHHQAWPEFWLDSKPTCTTYRFLVMFLVVLLLILRDKKMLEFWEDHRALRCVIYCCKNVCALLRNGSRS